MAAIAAPLKLPNYPNNTQALEMMVSGELGRPQKGWAFGKGWADPEAA